MNRVRLKGTIRNIQYSHNINDVEFYKAVLVVPRTRTPNKEDILNLKFKRFSNPYNDNDKIELIGNVRTYSQRLNGKNKVEVYVFTYFDRPESLENDTACENTDNELLDDIEEVETEITNACEIDGRICKKEALRKTRSGKDILDLIIANNIISDKQLLNCYIPCVAWGKNAKQLNQLQIGDKIKIIGQLQSREYRKRISDEDFEIRIAHEVNISSFEYIEE